MAQTAGLNGEEQSEMAEVEQQVLEVKPPDVSWDQDAAEADPSSDDALTWLNGSSEPIGLTISARATEVLRLGEYWGFAEWVAWGCCRHTQVTIHFGCGSLNIFDAFTPVHVAQEASAWEAHLHVIGCCVSVSGAGVASEMQMINHFLYCWKDVDDLASGSLSGSFAQNATTYASMPEAERHLLAHYGSQGYVVFFTEACGNCGPDTVCCHLGLPHTPASWKKIRREVHDSLLKLRSEAWFLAAFKSCQEYSNGHGSEFGGETPLSLCESSDESCDEPLPSMDAPDHPPPLPPPLIDDLPKSQPVALEEKAVSESHDEARHFSAPLTEMAHARREVQEEKIVLASKPKMIRHKRNVQTHLSERLRLGERLLQFAKGNDSKSMLKDFACAYMGHDKMKPLPSKTKCFLRRCKKVASGMCRPKLRGKLGRCRVDGAGRPPCTELEYALWNWYVDMCGACTTRIWPKTLLQAAKTIGSKLETIHRELEQPPPTLPEINGNWIWKFMKKYKIVWRQSNVKYKVSNAKLMRRSKRTWLQSQKVRYGLDLLHGGERAHKRPRFHSHLIDQKPLHMNEAESAGRGTLCWKGMPVVPLKSDVAKSRTRVSLNNHLCDDVDFEAPVEVCFKLKTSRCLKALRLPDSARASVRNSPSGSYDEDTFMAYLDQWIPAWSPSRAAAKDYRIMFLDDYKVHNMECVRQLLWDRGFFRIRIGGGCTSFQCGLDVHYHQCMSSDLQELEQIDFQYQQEQRPWKVPSRERQNLLDDVLSWWSCWPHARKGREALQMTAVTAALPPMVQASSFSSDGTYTPAQFALAASDDGRITKEARRWWDANNMCQARADAMRKVQEDFDRKKLSSVQDLWQYLEDESEPENEHCEGIEVEHVEEESDPESEPPEDFHDIVSAGGETPCLLDAPPVGGGTPAAADEGQPGSQVSGDGMLAIVEECKHSLAHEGSLQVAPAALSDADEDQKKLWSLTTDLVQYEQMFEMARKLNDPVAMMNIQQCKEDYVKLHNRLDHDVKLKLDERLAQSISEREAMRKRLRAEDAQAILDRKKKKLADNQKKEAAAKKTAEKMQEAKLLLELDKRWNEKDFGQGLPEGPGGAGPNFKKVAKKEIANYQQALERLRLRAPALPEHLAAQWEDLLSEFPLYWLETHRGKYGNNAGRRFMERLQALLQAWLMNNLI